MLNKLWRLIRQAPMARVTRGSQQDLGPMDQLNNLPKKLHHLEWNIVAFGPVSSITLCANTILEVSAIYF